MERKKRGLGFCVRGYRWCGPGCSGPGAPTNDVDACCKLHDQCYRRYGQCAYCDELFMKCLRPKINRYSKKGRDAALFYNLMKIRNSFRFKS
ncbi:Parvovirus coat protein VP1-like protein [Heyndrickxia ginsengihumi]|uniref:Parvovirus coat protein VP1-like protein n=1 Tax=Heyndrickxia ginsengihumi TaxID=363870 RepID=A0A6M0P507_9BACI|nr:Parvovirus coat protein VP1-like protein [Heyndrickxia ginsengihumi]MBE6184432.1 Parvovirus coat protein VP1-like protein [Bacillus sp. (in: firmicutes)]NEY19786.1 Parvovirus coat protein VP1-like protein [Heyndrickxia ginsengihumi]